MSESTSYWRRIVAAGVVYAAAGWGVVEALTTVVERLGLPAWLVPLVTALYIAGLPVTVFLVWRTAGKDRTLDAPSFIGATVVLVAVTAAIFWQTRPPPAEPGQLIAVLPCDFTGDAALAYRAEGLAEDVHARLSRVGSVKISSWNSSLFVRDRGFDTPEIVELLKADRLVRCRMTSGPERIQLTAELLDPRAGRILWGRDYDFVVADMGTVVTEVAGTLIDVLGTRAEAGERERVSALGTFSPEAYDLYLQARAAGWRWCRKRSRSIRTSPTLSCWTPGSSSPGSRTRNSRAWTSPGAGSRRRSHDPSGPWRWIPACLTRGSTWPGPAGISNSSSTSPATMRRRSGFGRRSARSGGTRPRAGNAATAC